MKYNIYEVGETVEDEPFDQTVGLNLSIRDGVYIFYKHNDHFPEVVYPVNAFWVMKEV